VELLQLDARSIRVSEYLTELPPMKLLQSRLHRAIEHAKEQAARRRAATFGLQLSRPPVEVPKDSLSAERDLAFLSEMMVRNSSLGFVAGTTGRGIMMAEGRSFATEAPPWKAPRSIQSR